MSSLAHTPAYRSRATPLEWIAASAIQPLHLLLASPAFLFLFALGAMLFRPPDVVFYQIDRFAFVLLLFALLLRGFLLKRPMRLLRPVTWPMLGMLILVVADLISQPFQSQDWSLLAAKWVVPFALYQVAGFVFDCDAASRKFETFAPVVLGYLCFIAIAFLVGANGLIFPHFILNEGIGIHFDRARGPFLQAVANGLTLNLLGLLALNAYRRGRLRGVPALLLLTALPIAVLATKTRAVWLSFGASIVALLILTGSSRLRKACLCLVLAAGLALVAVISLGDKKISLRDRLAERGPVAFRMAMYEAGWRMFLAKPFSGWGSRRAQDELERQTSGFRQDAFFFHNTYLEVAVHYGIAGVALYSWMVIDLFRLGKKRVLAPDHQPQTFLDSGFRSLWPILLLVYFFNGSFVVMNYQFVNGFLFTLAGMLAAQNRRLRFIEKTALSSEPEALPAMLVC